MDHSNDGDNENGGVLRLEAMRIRHPSLSEARGRDNFWIRQAGGSHCHRHSEHTLVADDDDGVWPEQVGGVGQVRNPIGPRPPPPVQGGRRGYRRFEASGEDDDSLFG